MFFCARSSPTLRILEIFRKNWSMAIKMIWSNPFLFSQTASILISVQLWHVCLIKLFFLLPCTILHCKCDPWNHFKYSWHVYQINFQKVVITYLPKSYLQTSSIMSPLKQNHGDNNVFYFIWCIPASCIVCILQYNSWCLSLRQRNENTLVTTDV